MLKKILLLSCLSFYIFGASQSKSAPSLKEITDTFKYKKYSKNVLTEFRNSMNYNGEAEYVLSEEIPNEIISYSEQPSTGVSSSRTTSMFMIKNGKLKSIKYIPVNANYIVDQEFDDNVKKYAGSGWGFAYNSEYKVTKDKKGTYIISTNIKKSGDADCCPSKYLQYKTTDFKKFTPYRISNNGVNWTTIK